MQNIEGMTLIVISKAELHALIINAVNACLKHHDQRILTKTRSKKTKTE